MKKALTRALRALVCFVMLFSSAAPALADGLEIGTTVSILVDSFEITSKTEDCTLRVGGSQELMVGVSGTTASYKWEVSSDGGASWTQEGTAATYDITNAQMNTPANVPYQYRVTVTSATGTTDSAIIRVLVSNDYAYRTIALRNGDTEVVSYMHDETRLVVTPLPDSVPAADELKGELAENCLPLVLYDVRLVNQNDEVVPYFGSVDVKFHVGSEYDGMTLRAFHLHDDTVTVYSGMVTDGDLTITVTGLSPFMVEVPAANTRTVTVNVGAGGSVTPSGTVNVADGSGRTFTLLPDAGYEISAVTVDGLPEAFNGNGLTLSNISQDHTVFVSFQPVTPSETLHTVTINAPAHGSVYPSGDIQVRHGLAQTIYFYPDENYELDTVTVNNVAVNVIGNSFTLSTVTGDTEISVSFRQGTAQPPNVHKNISASAGANGSISPMGDVSVEYGGDMYFYFIPNSGYEVDELTIDGTAKTVTGNSYHFVNVVDTHTISVTFKRIVTPPPPPPPTYHTITASSGANGDISPSGSIQVQEGGAQTFSFIPDANYEINTVTIDGVTTAVSGSAYTFTGVTGDHTISVDFRQRATPPTPTPTPTTTPTPALTPTPTPRPTLYYTIAAGSGENGAISPDGDVRIAEGRRAYFYFLPDEGYEQDVVTVDGRILDVEGSSYCFEDVDADHSIHVTFKKAASPEPTVYHSIAVTAEGEGRISPSGDVQVSEGGAQTFYLIADEGYEVEAIYVNGEKQDVVGSQFTVDGITDDMELRVSFKPISAPISDSAPHCFLCDWAGRDIAPWCWLIPIILVAALGGALWLLLRKRRK